MFYATCTSFQSTHSHLFLQGDDKLYINQGDSLQKIYHNCIDGNDPSFYSANTQGNMFSQSYNIRTNTYMSGDYVSVANEGKQKVNQIEHEDNFV